jgi:hypothetical protein
MSANPKSKETPSNAGARRSFWEGFRSAFDFKGAVDTASDYLPLGQFPKITIDVTITDGLDSDLANLNADIANLTADARAATRKVLSKRPS